MQNPLQSIYVKLSHLRKNSLLTLIVSCNCILVPLNCEIPSASLISEYTTLLLFCKVSQGQMSYLPLIKKKNAASPIDISKL